ncbi:hypothetical protein C8J56DRAFT_1171059 [Mycena floridula]|nr:hypothetical protein C8J56DRAFT_1171059 [Mycena floridula]
MVKDLARAYYEGSRQDTDLDDEVRLLRERLQVELCPDLSTPPARLSSLQGLAAALHARFSQSKHPDGLRDAIVFYIEVIAASGPPDHDGLRRLDQEIAVILSQRFHLLRPNYSDEDRKAGIFHVESAPRMIPYHGPGRREELVASMIIKIAKVFEIGPIDDVIDLDEFTLPRCPKLSSERGALLYQYADALLSRQRLPKGAGSGSSYLPEPRVSSASYFTSGV